MSRDSARPDSQPILFALGATRRLGDRIANGLGASLGGLEEREFEDGEHKSRPLENVRGRHTVVIHSLFSDAEQSVDDKLIRLLFFLACLRDASADRITALIPYLAYARKDRKTQPRDPVTTRYLAALLESVGVDRVVCMDVHNLAAYQNAFRCRADHLEAVGLFVKHFTPLLAGAARITVVSPDAGGMKRAQRFRAVLSEHLGVDASLAFVEKARAGGRLTVGRLVGELTGGIAIIVDDMISTGGTLIGAARASKQAGATTVFAAATHGVFAEKANETLADPALDGIVVTDTLPAVRISAETVRRKLTMLETSHLFAQAIQRIHCGGSLVELLTPPFR